MTGSITTCMPNSFRQEILEGGHCFFATLAQSGNVFNSNNLVNNLTSTANLSVGMGVASTHTPSNTFIAYFVNSTAFVMSNNATGAAQETVTVTADTFKLAVIKFALTGTYDKNITNYSQLTGNTDEVGASGTYSAGGFALTNINPSIPDSNTAITSFSVNPSWTSTSIDAEGCMIYNSTARISNTTGRVVSLHDFGGEQKVTAGTFTINFPTANGTASILRLA